MDVGERTRRRLATAAAVTQFVLAMWLGVFLLGVVPRARPPLPGTGPGQVGALLALTLGLTAFTVVGMLLARARPQHPMVAVLLAPSVLTTFQLAQVSAGVLGERGGWPGLSVLAFTTRLFWLVTPAALVVLLIRLPTGEPVTSRWRVYERFVLAHFGLITLLYAFLPDPGGVLLPVANPLGVPSLARLAPVSDALLALAVPHLGIGLVALILRYRRGDDLVRQQLRWVAAGAVVLVLTSVVASLGVPWVVEAAGITVFAAGIGIAVLRYRLWDLGLVVRRSLLYGILTTLLTCGYVGLVLALRRVVPGDLLPELLVTAIVAVIALPLRELLQRALDRAVFGQRRDPIAVVRGLGLRLAAEPGPALPAVLEELATAMRLPGLAVRLPDGTVAAAAGSAGDDGLRIPLRHRATEVGELVAGRRHPAEPLTGRDVQLLTDLAGHLGLTVHSALLDEALRRSHERLLAARTAERDRLRRDLHDDLGPVLGSASLRVRAARNLLAQPSPGLDRVRGVLDGVETDLVDALEGINRILVGLQPSVLTDRGLLAALREHAATWAGRLTLRLDLPELLPALDPEVEATAYRIAVEGLRNADRHSGGATVTLRLRVQGGQLEVDVDDDGHGLTDTSGHPAIGIGVSSMRERARAVGGSLCLEPATPSGLRVHGVLPVGAR